MYISSLALLKVKEIIFMLMSNGQCMFVHRVMNLLILVVHFLYFYNRSIYTSNSFVTIACSSLRKQLVVKAYIYIWDNDIK